MIIVDYLMAGLTGDKLIQRLREFLTPSCIIVLISGHTDMIEPLNLKELGIYSFLPKPIDMDRLMDIIEKKQSMGSTHT